jgi:hypothetical protein
LLEVWRNPSGSGSSQSGSTLCSAGTKPEKGGEHEAARAARREEAPAKVAVSAVRQRRAAEAGGAHGARHHGGARGGKGWRR